MEKGHLTGSLYLDLRKAFDTVIHGRLLSKLELYGIKSKELLWFETHLFGHSLDLVDNKVFALSTPIPATSILHVVSLKAPFWDLSYLLSTSMIWN